MVCLVAEKTREGERGVVFQKENHLVSRHPKEVFYVLRLTKCAVFT